MLDTIGNIFIVLSFLLSLVLGGTLAFSIMARILHKSNNLGSDKTVDENITMGFTVCKSVYGHELKEPSSVIYNPVIIKNNHTDDKESYLNEKTLGTLDDQIESEDLSDIKWHE